MCRPVNCVCVCVAVVAVFDSSAMINLLFAPLAHLLTLARQTERFLNLLIYFMHPSGEEALERVWKGGAHLNQLTNQSTSRQTNKPWGKKPVKVM